MGIETLKRRSQFQRIRGGGRWSTPSFVLEGKPRADLAGAPSGARFGFTVTKKLGCAVVRNRIRRRLKAAIVAIAREHADTTCDYVVVAREAAFVQPFEKLCAELGTAFHRVNARTSSPKVRERPPSAGGNTSRKQ